MNGLFGAICLNQGNPSSVERKMQQHFERQDHQVSLPAGRFFSTHPIEQVDETLGTGIIHDVKRAGHSLSLSCILELWNQLGRSVLNELVGHFSLTLWNHRTGGIWAIRDVFGALPLHYYSSADSFCFASRAKSLWHLPPKAAQKLNDARILDFIIDDLEHACQTSTFRQNIHKVQMGGCLHWQNGDHSTDSYWNPDLKAPRSFESDEEIYEQFESLLCESLSIDSKPDQYSALLTSGGLDSNSILAAWKKRGADKAPGNCLISLIPEKGNRADAESRMLLEEVNKATGFPHFWITPTQAVKKMEPAETFVANMEDPFGMHSLSGPAPCYHLAASLGIQRAMDGIDGDLVAGIPWGYWRFLWQKGHFKESISECFAHHKQWGRGKAEALKELLRTCLDNSLPQILSLFSSIRRKTEHDRNQVQQWQKTLQIRTSSFPESAILERLKLLASNHHVEQEGVSIAHLVFEGMKSPMLGVGIDRYGLAADQLGVQAMHPFLDKSLAEFLLRLPWDWRVKKGKEKRLLRDYLAANQQSTLAKQEKLDHIGYWFTLEFQKDYIRRHPKPKNDCLDALNHYIDASWIQSSWREASSMGSNQELHETFWRLIILSEWIIHHSKTFYFEDI